MQCRVCDGSRLSLAIDLGKQPRANQFLSYEELGKEPYYPLRVVHCHDCQTAQLDHTIQKEEVNANHTYLSGVTRSLQNHFADVADEVDRRFFAHVPRKSCLDIGSNDGTQLLCYKKLGYDVLGVDPAHLPVQIALQQGVPTLEAFFNLELAQEMHCTFDVINAAGVFFHLEELHSVTEGIHKCLKSDGVFVVQFIYVKAMMDNVAFDQIYHEHLLYYSLKTVNCLLQRHGLELFDARFASIHGGSIIGFAGHRGKRSISDRLVALQQAEEASGCNEIDAYYRFAQNMKALKEDNLRFIEAQKRANKRLFGLGAPVKGNTLLNYFGIGPDILEVLVEKNPLRNGMFSPGKHIPIIMEEAVKTHPNIYYVLAWNFRSELLKNYAPLIAQGVLLHFPVIA
ncbi:MAG: hypothetical protein RL235_440 [Chlamydiota bacterium]|jgi:2-polyprenyl-3-methyl-5-hydroxy-6-metoxy-1,4-benzoquinol methylase